MKNESRSKIILGNCTVHVRKDNTFKLWAIVVMPYNFKVDNYYHGVHVHPDRAVIPIKNMETILEIVCKHIERENGLKENKLRKELGL